MADLRRRSDRRSLHRQRIPLSVDDLCDVGVNAIVNPGFEDGTLNGWTVFQPSFAAITGDAIEGSYSAELEGTGPLQQYLGVVPVSSLVESSYCYWSEHPNQNVFNQVWWWYSDGSTGSLPSNSPGRAVIRSLGLRWRR